MIFYSPGTKNFLNRNMMNKLSNFWDMIRISIVRFTLHILFLNKTKPIVLKHLEMKINMITPAEFEGWVLADAQGL